MAPSAGPGRAIGEYSPSVKAHPSNGPQELSPASPSAWSALRISEQAQIPNRTDLMSGEPAGKTAIVTGAVPASLLSANLLPGMYFPSARQGLRLPLPGDRPCATWPGNATCWCACPCELGPCPWQ